ncbi:hypothetical protein ACRALDRAFT_211173 [Sodiomyces alcalophilus JCM 7366]|uniref:uncharacterized protein n=1 Tax=Sodiomyces alcalophilus JCM 7366 TaxID=591952 RepID=UPI0039B5E44A
MAFGQGVWAGGLAVNHRHCLTCHCLMLFSSRGQIQAAGDFSLPRPSSISHLIFARSISY